jgi:hypothetical protein
VQKLIADIIERNGGSATFEVIHDECVKKWHTLRRRDGTPYVADPKRSIHASLSKSPACGQVFERDERKEGHWRLTPDAVELYKYLKTTGEDFDRESESEEEIQVDDSKSEKKRRREPAEGDSKKKVKGEKNDSGSTSPALSSSQEKKKLAAYNNNEEPEAEGESQPDEEEEDASGSQPQSQSDKKATSAPTTRSSKKLKPASEEEEDMNEGKASTKKRKRRAAGGLPSRGKGAARPEGELDATDGEPTSALNITPLQELVIQIIHKHGGSCPYNRIVEELSERVTEDKTLMASLNWHNQRKSTIPTTAPGDKTMIVFKKSTDAAQNEVWTVADPKLMSYVVNKKPLPAPKRAKSDGHKHKLSSAKSAKKTKEEDDTEESTLREKQHKDDESAATKQDGNEEEAEQDENK